MQFRKALIAAVVVAASVPAAAVLAGAGQGQLTCSVNSGADGELYAIVRNVGALPVPKGVRIELQTRTGALYQSYVKTLAAPFGAGKALQFVVARPATSCKASANWVNATDYVRYDGAGARAKVPFDATAQKGVVR